MQPQHATSQARGDVTASSVDTSGASVQANEAASEHDAPSVQSITQSQLADDERSEEEKADRLPRSSKIYRKRDSSSHKESRRKSNSHELPAAGHMASADNDSQNLAHEASSPSEMQRNTPTQATFGHRRSAGSPKGMAISPVIPTENSEAAVGPNEAQSKHESRLSSSSAYMALQSRYFTRSPNRAASQDSVTSRNPPNGESNGASSFQRQVPDPVGHSKIVNEVDAQLSIQPTQSGSANESVTPGARRPNSIHQAVEQPTSAESRLNLPKSSNTLDVPRHPNAATGDRDAPRSPSRDVSGGRPSMESLPSQIDPDRPPSPMSPQLPIQMTGSPRGRPVVPAHHGIEHNFGPQPSHEETERRSRSFSRPFNSSLERKRSGASDLQQYPPSMQRQLSTEDMVMPDGFYPRPISREQAMVPRSQTSEYAIEGVGPPDVPPKDSKPRSRRGSRSSTFLKSLAKSFTDSDSPSFQNSTADQGHHSPATSGADATPKSKRSSIWGLRKSQLDLSNESTKKSPPTTVPRSELSRTSTNITQLPAPTPPPKKSLEALDDEFPMRPKQRVTTSFSKRLQRIPTSETKEINKEAEVGKKNRLSTLGSIFSRSGHKRNNSSKHARHPSEGESSKPSQPMLPSMQENVRYTSAQAAASPSFEPDPSSYQSQQGLVQPPIGGYYAPRTRKASSQQSRPPAHSNTHQQHTQLQQQPTSPGRDLPAYFEAASLRQQSSPRVSPPASRSSRVSTTLLRKASQADQKEASPSGQRRESRSKGSIWGRVSAQAPSKGRSSQSIPSIGGPFKYNSYAATPHESQTGHTLGHNIRHPTSPPPPPPPPKDEWHRAAPRRSSLAANNPTSSNAAATPSNVLGPSPPDDRQRFILPPLQTNVPNVLTHQHIPHEQQGYTLPPLQTEIPTPHLGTIRSGLSSGTPTTVTNTPGMTFEEKRRSRQYEIEVGHMSPSGGPQSPQHKRRSRQLELETGHMSPAKNPGSMSPAEKRRSRQMEIETGHLSPGGGNTSPQATAGLALKQVREDKDSEAEEPIRMNATSFPGQEWRPDTKYAWLGD
ncbi:uncharacterized protein KY384_001029 [Bacidia gigantensis]|uniref:uncharacterized protein n=1 Tax=Bacidia gigantensis TaxID=2732470 RepID=UPI001D03C87A|nr:uncharacterized protein KY384_001029 [Bacidia gigantensis]KAG8534185.1 hypothetical protein KY384_001029 [Bacidia gigantensis]